MHFKIYFIYLLLQGSSGVTSVVKAVTVYNGVFHKVIQGEFAMIIQKENIGLFLISFTAGLTCQYKT